MTPLQWLVTKYLITSGIVVLVSEIVRRSDRLGAFLGALPLIAILTMLWLHAENQDRDTIAGYAWFTFWYVIPTLPMFLLFPWLIHRFGFWGALGSALLLTIVCFGLLALVMRRFGVELF